VHSVAIGTKPTCRDKSRMSAFRGKADKRRGLVSTALFADDPQRTYRGLKSRNAAASRRAEVCYLSV